MIIEYSCLVGDFISMLVQPYRAVPRKLKLKLSVFIQAISQLCNSLVVYPCPSVLPSSLPDILPSPYPTMSSLPPEKDEFHPKLLHPSSDLPLLQSLPPHSSSNIIHLIRSGIPIYNRTNLTLKSRTQFKNNLLAGVGYLELANAGDFAANVWNQIPVPKHAVVLMAIGGPVGLLMTVVALRDFRLGLANIRLLLEERRHLHRLRMEYADRKDSQMVSLLDCRLGVSYREIGTEVIDRIVMDGLMGIGSLLVGTGTIMAIWGRYPTVFHASNLLSGYVGNSMAALFGLTNAMWSAYLIWRFRRLLSTVGQDDAETGPSADELKGRLHARFRKFQNHAFVHGVNGLVAGAASMVTATMWWGYVVLVPCIIGLILCNYFWRWRLGYDRPALLPPTTPVFTSPVEELDYVSSMQAALAQGDSLPLSRLDSKSLESVITFITQNDMFEPFVEWLIRDKSVISTILPPDFSSRKVLTLSPDDMLKVSDPTRSRMLLLKANEFVKDAGRRMFAYRERYLLELVGYRRWLEYRVN